MPAYVIADVEVLDTIGYEEYRQKVPATITAYGGRYLARGGATEVLEGAMVAEALRDPRVSRHGALQGLVGLSGVRAAAAFARAHHALASGGDAGALMSLISTRDLAERLAGDRARCASSTPPCICAPPSRGRTRSKAVAPTTKLRTSLQPPSPT